MKYTHLIAAFLLLMISTPLLAQDTYIPDRPGIGNGSFITPIETLGLETGIQYSRTPSLNQIDVGQLLLRYGIGGNAEIRASLNSYTSQEVTLIGGTDTNQGMQDVGLGAKYNLLSQDGSKPNVSLLGNLSIPAGSDAFSNEEFVPSLGALLDYSISGTLGISSNLGYSFEVGNVNDYWMFTLTPGFVISSDQQVSGYAGYAGFFYGDGFTDHFLEGGVTFTLDSGAQLDVNTGYESESEYFFIGIGFAQAF